MVSLTYLIPLPLYGSGGRKDLTFAATNPTSSFESPSIAITFFVTLADSFRKLVIDWVRITQVKI